MNKSIETATVGKNLLVRVPLGVCRDLKVNDGDKLVFIKKGNNWEVINQSTIVNNNS